MKKLTQQGKDRIIHTGKIFEIIQKTMVADDKKVIFEIARRSPGIRLIICRDGKILMSKEYRNELNDFDYRLPGGKVFDTQNENTSKSRDILAHAKQAAIKECLEETGLITKQPRYFVTSRAGSTIEWDLYYFIIDEFTSSKQGQSLETGEVITTEWKTIDEIKTLAKQGCINEYRSLGVLFQLFLQKET